MGNKSFRVNTYHPTTVDLGSKTVSGILSSSDSTVDSDDYIMTTEHINALIQAKGSPHLQHAAGTLDDWTYEIPSGLPGAGTKSYYRGIQPWILGSQFSQSAKGYGGSYAYMIPMYVEETSVVKGFRYQCYNGSTKSGDDYLYLCIYEADNGADNAANVRNFPNALVGHFVCENPDGASSGYSYFTSVNVDNQAAGETYTYNSDSKIYNSSGNVVSSLTLNKGHYWMIVTASTSTSMWGSWNYSHGLSPRMWKLDGQGSGFGSNGYRINGNQSSYVPDYSLGQWLTTWKDNASGKDDGSWTPPTTFDEDHNGNASATRIASAFPDYYNINYPNVLLLTDGIS